MLIRPVRFNFYLLVAVGLVLPLFLGCQSPERKKKKQLATFSLHLESGSESSEQTEMITVFRDNPTELKVQKAPFLTAANVARAKVIESLGSFSISVQFDRQGTWLLEQYSTANRGRHFAIFCQFVPPGEEKLNNGRWLSAPKISRRITDGMLIFTPDASRAEAEIIVNGLMNVAKKVQEKPFTM
jgi:preprotein translocase subunit SecD